MYPTHKHWVDKACQCLQSFFFFFFVCKKRCKKSTHLETKSTLLWKQRALIFVVGLSFVKQQNYPIGFKHNILTPNVLGENVTALSCVCVLRKQEHPVSEIWRWRLLWVTVLWSCEYIRNMYLLISKTVICYLIVNICWRESLMLIIS